MPCKRAADLEHRLQRKAEGPSDFLHTGCSPLFSEGLQDRFSGVVLLATQLRSSKSLDDVVSCPSTPLRHEVPSSTHTLRVFPHARLNPLGVKAQAHLLTNHDGGSHPGALGFPPHLLRL